MRGVGLGTNGKVALRVKSEVTFVVFDGLLEKRKGQICSSDNVWEPVHKDYFSANDESPRCRIFSGLTFLVLDAYLFSFPCVSLDELGKIVKSV